LANAHLKKVVNQLDLLVDGKGLLGEVRQEAAYQLSHSPI
jgi:hypothetical protein